MSNHACLAVEGIEHNFHSAGNAQLIEDPEQIILNRVLGELQTPRNFAIGESLGDASHYVRLAGGEWRVGQVGEVGMIGLRQGFKQEM